MTFKQCTVCLFMALSFFACKNDTQTAVPEQTQTDGSDGPSAYTKLPVESIPTKDGAISLPVKDATITWQGSKFYGGAHTGTISLKSGEILVKNGFVLGGELIFDMNSLKNTDIEDPKKRKNLEDHLKKGDFFETNKYPTAKFVITETLPSMNVKGINRVVVGDLTVKDKTNSINIPLTISVTDTEVVATSANFAIDRTKWGIVYHSSLVETAKDELIADEIMLTFSFSAGK